MSLIARTDGDSAKAPTICRALRDAEVPLAYAGPVAASSLAKRRLPLWLVATFGLTALFLAVGVYGVMTQAVG